MASPGTVIVSTNPPRVRMLTGLAHALPAVISVGPGRLRCMDLDGDVYSIEIDDAERDRERLLPEAWD